MIIDQEDVITSHHITSHHLPWYIRLISWYRIAHERRPRGAAEIGGAWEVGVHQPLLERDHLEGPCVLVALVGVGESGGG